MKSGARLVIGSRGSPLALAQTELVRRALATADPELRDPAAVEVRIIRTSGDRFLERPLAELGGKGLFVKEIEEALLDRAIDLAVHSMKDMPTRLPDGLTIGAYLPRADVRDLLLSPHGASLDALPAGAVVGTSSLRRQAQLLARRPDLRVVPLRGNVQTRLAKLERGEVAATFLAAAGLARLGIETAMARPLAVEEMLPAVGQGAIGVECRANDWRTLDILHRLDHLMTRLCVEAERSFLAQLDGSCRTPIAALCESEDEQVIFRGLVAAPDGSFVQTIQRRGARSQAVELATEAGVILARSKPFFGPADEGTPLRDA